MKKVRNLTMLFVALSLCSCSTDEVSATNIDKNVDNTKNANSNDEDSEIDVDVDLTELSGVMVYTKVYDMVYSPEENLGKIVKAKGFYTSTADPSTLAEYHFVVIPDATACCETGLEIRWQGERVYPDDYPQDQQEIEVIGEFSSYNEGEYTFYCLELLDFNIIEESEE